jgi:putative AlgH/UPF0301 family transcriptional regulator
LPSIGRFEAIKKGVHMSDDFKPGAIFAAHPDLEDPVFGRSVMLVLSGGEGQGTIAVNLAGPALSRDGKVLDGGPESSPVLLMLHNRAGHEPSQPVGETGYFLTALGPDAAGKLQPADLLENRPEKFHLFDGYGGWSLGQFAHERSAGAWAPVSTSLDALISAPREQRWTLAATSAGLIEPAAPQEKAPATPAKPPKPPGT